MYQNVTKEDVMRVYNQYIKGKGAVHLSVLPKGQETLIAGANNFVTDSSSYTAPEYGYNGLKYVKAKDNFDRSKIPGNGPNPSVKVPKFWRKDLSNGIRMIGTESTEVPTVTITITIPGGHMLQAADTAKIGLASLFASMMNEDTKIILPSNGCRTAKLGSSITTSSSFDGITFSIQTLKEH